MTTEAKSNHEMCTVKYFKAAKKTKRFNMNQKVWITLECANHLYIRFKYRGKGRYVNGVVDKFAKCVGEIKSIEVSKDFANILRAKTFPTPSMTEAMEKMQDLVVRSQPKPKE